MLATATATIDELISDSWKEMDEANLRRKDSVSNMKMRSPTSGFGVFGKGKVR